MVFLKLVVYDFVFQNYLFQKSVTNVRACEPEPRAASRKPIFASHCFFFLIYIYFLAFSS